MGDIAEAQRTEPNLRRQLAARVFYRGAKRLQTFGGSVALMLALVAPLIRYWDPDAGPILGAVAGLWIFLTRLVVRPLRGRRREMGAVTQEQFDVEVLQLTPNLSLKHMVSEEEIRRASGDAANLANTPAWYPTDADTAWPASVLICQRSNAVWARRQHRSYGLLLTAAAGLWFLVGVGVGIASDASLATYLAALALPSLPALLDASELAREHLKAATQRQETEQRINNLLDAATATEADLREIQDEVFSLRRGAALVPEWYYKLVAGRFENDMRYAAKQIAERGE
ncbi:MAG: S-4TM family putative pore-forming effector [bacterium]|nr:S-4TM family putative pore-forming effector [bacterium]MDE0600403.1 S-4TM family putative pore-forming effector [bacterium]